MAASQMVTSIVESINGAFASFNPESVVPDVEGFMEHFPEIFEAIKDGVLKFADKADDTLPLHSQVKEELRDFAPVLDGHADRARELNTTFRRLHADDLKRHYEPRTGERAWNVPA